MTLTYTDREVAVRRAMTLFRWFERMEGQVVYAFPRTETGAFRVITDRPVVVR